MKETIRVEGGKYTFISNNGVMSCLRYGEQWKDYIGDKAVGALFDYAKELEDRILFLSQKITNDVCCPECSGLHSSWCDKGDGK